jgi:hypothetical protein
VIHGKLGRVRITGTVPTTEPALAASLANGGLLLTITEATKRHWSPDGELAVNTSEGVVADSYIVDNVRGTVTFSTPHSTDLTWTVDAEWMPTSCLGLTKNWTLDVSNDVKDASVFACTTAEVDAVGWRQFAPGLGEGTVSLSRLAGSSETTGPPFTDRQSLQAPLYLELYSDYTTGGRFECFARIQGRSNDVSVGDLLGETVTLKVDGPLYWTTST